MPNYIIRQRNLGQAEAKCLRPRPKPKFWPWGHFGLEDLTSLVICGLFQLIIMPNCGGSKNRNPPKFAKSSVLCLLIEIHPLQWNPTSMKRKLTIEIQHKPPQNKRLAWNPVPLTKSMHSHTYISREHLTRMLKFKFEATSIALIRPTFH